MAKQQSFILTNQLPFSPSVKDILCSRPGVARQTEWSLNSNSTNVWLCGFGRVNFPSRDHVREGDDSGARRKKYDNLYIKALNTVPCILQVVY